MDRPKRKLKIGDSSTYLWPRRFEFVSPFSVEECASRLEAKDSRGLFYNTRTEVWRVGDDTYAFNLVRGDRSRVGARGYLKRWEAQTTHVTGEVGIEPEFILIILTFMMGMLFFLAMGIRDGNLAGATALALFLAFLSSIGVYFTKIQRDFAFYLIEDTLHVVNET